MRRCDKKNVAPSVVLEIIIKHGITYFTGHKNWFVFQLSVRFDAICREIGRLACFARPAQG